MFQNYLSLSQRSMMKMNYSICNILCNSLKINRGHNKILNLAHRCMVMTLEGKHFLSNRRMTTFHNLLPTLHYILHPAGLGLTSFTFSNKTDLWNALLRLVTPIITKHTEEIIPVKFKFAWSMEKYGHYI